VETPLASFATAAALPASPAVTRAKSLLAVSLAKVLASLQAQLDEYRRRITQAFREHPDHDIFGGLPGAKAVLAPRRLAELGSVREEYPEADGLMCQAGVSPVNYQSGQIDQCRLRRACDKVLRFTGPLWADASRKKCAWSRASYERQRGEGHRHASALRCLGKRWLKNLWRLWVGQVSVFISRFIVETLMAATVPLDRTYEYAGKRRLLRGVPFTIALGGLLRRFAGEQSQQWNELRLMRTRVRIQN
jgi:hypothetical protein